MTKLPQWFINRRCAKNCIAYTRALGDARAGHLSRMRGHIGRTLHWPTNCQLTWLLCKPWTREPTEGANLATQDVPLSILFKWGLD